MVGRVVVGAVVVDTDATDVDPGSDDDVHPVVADRSPASAMHAARPGERGEDDRGMARAYRRLPGNCASRPGLSAELEAGRRALAEACDARGPPHQPQVPDAPLKGPTTRLVIQPP